MKIVPLWFLIVLQILAIQRALAGDSPYSFELRSADVHVLLDGYRMLFGVQLVVSSTVSNLAAKVTTPAVETANRGEARRLIEQAAVEQAGIVFTDLSDGRVSVTYNEFLSRKGKDPGFVPQRPLTSGRPQPYTPRPPEPLPVKPPTTRSSERP